MIGRAFTSNGHAATEEEEEEEGHRWPNWAWRRLRQRGEGVSACNYWEERRRRNVLSGDKMEGKGRKEGATGRTLHWRNSPHYRKLTILVQKVGTADLAVEVLITILDSLVFAFGKNALKSSMDSWRAPFLVRTE